MTRAEPSASGDLSASADACGATDLRVDDRSMCRSLAGVSSGLRGADSVDASDSAARDPASTAAAVGTGGVGPDAIAETEGARDASTSGMRAGKKAISKRGGVGSLNRQAVCQAKNVARAVQKRNEGARTQCIRVMRGSNGRVPLCQGTIDRTPFQCASKLSRKASREAVSVSLLHESSAVVHSFPAKLRIQGVIQEPGMIASYIPDPDPVPGSRP